MLCFRPLPWDSIPKLHKHIQRRRSGVTTQEGVVRGEVGDGEGLLGAV